MKIGWSTLGNPDWTIEQIAQAAKEYGYDGVELRILDGEVITPGRELTVTVLPRALLVRVPGPVPARAAGPALAGLPDPA